MMEVTTNTAPDQAQVERSAGRATVASMPPATVARSSPTVWIRGPKDPSPIIEIFVREASRDVRRFPFFTGQRPRQ